MDRRKDKECAMKGWHGAVAWGLILLVAAAAALAQDSPGTVPTAVPAAEDGGMSLGELVRHGGSVMKAIGALSVAGLALIFYCFFTVRMSLMIPEVFIAAVGDHLRAGRFREAEQLCRNKPNFIARVLLPAFPRVGRARDVVEETIRSSGAREASRLWQRISYLADIGTIAPMLGLLGTVLGMMQAFNAVVDTFGEVKPIYLSAGISKALGTTAAGLIVGIPALAFYTFFRGRVQRVIVTAEGLASDMVDHFTRRKRGSS